MSQVVSAWRIEHSHITATRQPAALRAATFLRSRSTFFSNFSAQNAALVPGVVVYRQPEWRCQKQPWMKTTALYRRMQRSGRPGSFALWSRNRNPAACSALRTRISGDVFFPRMPDIILARVWRSTTSIIRYGICMNEGKSRAARLARGRP